MAMVLDEATTSKCNHCERVIPSPNIDLHYAHCLRNLEKCKICSDVVPKKLAEEHYLSTHAPANLYNVHDAPFVLVACSLCGEVVERVTLDVHTGENCPRRMVTCEYCEFALPVIDLFEHQEVCGNRTEYCHQCRKYVRLCNRVVHETSCTGVHDDIADPSRDVRPRERERDQQPPRGRRNLLFSVAITGVAVILGSLFFQEKNRHQ